MRYARRKITEKRVKQTGLRRRYMEALDEINTRFPRKTLMNHGADWYTDGHLVDGRPLFSILAMSNYAEYLAYHLKFGRRGQKGVGEKEITELFAATRRAMFYVLKKYPCWRTLTKKEAGSFRARIARLVDLARAARAATNRKAEGKETQSV